MTLEGGGTCLFLVEGGPIVVDAPGGASPVIRSRLEMLCGRVEEIVVAVVGPGTWWGSPELPDSIEAIEPLAAATEEELRRLISRYAVGWIWAEHYTPAKLSSVSGLPYVYGHHDWLSKIKPLRYPGRYRGLVGGLRRVRLSLAERRVVRRARACVTSSSSECRQIDSAGGRAYHVPLTYPDLSSENHRSPESRRASVQPPAEPRIVHLGGMQTTANVRGLESLLDRIAARRPGDLPPLTVIGSLEGAPERLLETLRAHGADLTGFVERLDQALRPFDIHVVPWQHDTGTRTKIPLALRSRQVVVSTRPAAAAFPELESDVNCVLVDTLDEMVERIRDLAGKPEERQRIGLAARATFLTHFTREAVQPRFDQVLTEILSEP